METLNLNNLILNIFESQCDKIFFPVESQVVCRRFVKWLHEDGVPFSVLSDEVGESEREFSLWRKGLTKRRVGEKVMRRINKCFNDLFESVDFVVDDSYEAVFKDEHGLCDSVVDDSYEAVFKDEHGLCDFFEGCKKFSKPSKKRQNMGGNSKRFNLFKRTKISMGGDRRAGDRFLDKFEDDFSRFGSDYEDAPSENHPSSSDYEECDKKFHHDSIPKLKYIKNCPNSLENVVDKLLEDSINAAIEQVDSKAKEELPKEKAVKKLSSDSFKSCLSNFQDAQQWSGGDASVSLYEESHDFELLKPVFEDSSQVGETSMYHNTTPPNPLATKQTSQGFLYVFSQPINNIHRFKLGASSDLDSVRKTVSEYNLDLSLVASHEVQDTESSLSEVSASVQQFKVNNSNWFEAEYAVFMGYFSEAIKNIIIKKV